MCFVSLGSLPVLAKEYGHHGMGGEELQQTLLAKALTGYGYEVSMVVGDYGQNDEEKWYEITTYKAYKLKEGLPFIRFLYPRVFKLWRALKRANADVYYASCAGYQVGIVALFTRIHKKSAVYRIASDSDCDPKKLLIPNWRDKKIYEYGIRNVNRVLAQSKSQQENMLTNYRIRSDIAAMLVENCSSPRIMDARDIPVLWVSNVRQLKRPDIAVDVAESMPGMEIHMIGGPVSGHEKLFLTTQQRAKKVDNLHFHGPVPYHDISQYYDRAKLFINTSDIEGFPNSYLQAWAHGTPVIAFFDPDNLISKEGLGLRVANSKEMASALEFYLSDRAAWEAASKRCHAFMMREYGEAKVIKPYARAIDKAASEG